MNRLIDRARRSGLVALALSASLPGVGCHTMWTKTTTTTAGAAGSPGSGEPAGPKTDFHREVGPEQQYNVHMELARFHESQGNHEAAAAAYKMASDVCEKKGSALAHSKLGPAQHATAQRRMASALDRLGRFSQAETHYLAALKLAPGDPKVWNDAGYSYYVQNRLADAERSLKTADALEPNNPRVQTNLGLTLAAEGKDQEALAALTRAGGPAVGHANFGYIVAAMGKTDLAREHYKKALDLQPELTPARQALAKLDSGPPGRPPSALASTGAPPVNLLATAPPKPAFAVKLKEKDRDSQVSRASATKPAALPPGLVKPVIPADVIPLPNPPSRVNPPSF